LATQAAAASAKSLHPAAAPQSGRDTAAASSARQAQLPVAAQAAAAPGGCLAAQAACCAPRWKLTRDFTLDVESTMRAETIAGLKGLGHQLKAIDDPYMDFGSGQFIWRLSDLHEDGYVAASDSRRDGQAVGF
jgi:gamma-glutamyltranspeptidase